MLARLDVWLRRQASATVPWTNVYGVARTVLALSMALTLAANRMTTIFRPIAGIPYAPPFCHLRIQKVGFFCVLGAHHLEIARWIAVGLLLLVASGWRPRFTGVVHWWIALSFQLSGSTLEGGDQACAILTMLLVPVTLTDGRRWHWQPPPAAMVTGDGEIARRIIALSAMLMIRIQVSAVYFHATIGKTAVREWYDGTALYYWLHHPTFGLPGDLRMSLGSLLVYPGVVSVLTWGTIVVELFLCMGLVATRRIRKVLLVVGFCLHGGILVFMGLFSFSVTMFGALILYLRPWDEVFEFSWFARAAGRARAVWQQLRRRLVATGEQEPERTTRSAPAPTLDFPR